MRIGKAMLGGLLVVVMVASSPPTANARICMTCHDWIWENGKVVHDFMGQGAYASCEFNDCHSYAAYGNCFNHHGGCWASADKVEKEVRFAITEGDLGALRGLLAEPEAESGVRAVVNLEHRTIDILSCDGTIASRISAPAATFTHLTE